MADELSLLFKIRGDAAGVKSATAEAKAAVAQLRQSFGPELAQTVSVTNKAFSEIADNLNVFVGQRLPLFGGAFIRVTENIRGFGGEAKKQEAAIRKVADSIADLSTKTGKSIPDLTRFLTQFAKIEGQANRDASALKFFGNEVLANNKKLIPELEKTAEGLSMVAVESKNAGAGLRSLATPVGIAALALAGLSIGIVVVTKQLFDLSKKAADFQGKMFDLAQQTGVAVETLSALEIVARTTGGNIDSITQSLVLFQRKLEEAQDPTSKAADKFRDLGVSVNDTETSFREALTALAAMPEGFSQTNAAAELFGARGGKQVLAILKETNGDLDAAITKFRAMGILISDDVARAADKFNDEFALLEFQLRALAGVAAKELIPAMVEIVRGLSGLVDAARPVAAVFGSIAGPVVRSLAHALRGLGVVVLALTGNYKGLAEAAKKAREAQGPIPVQGAPAVTPAPLPSAPTSTQSAAAAASQAETVVAIVRRAAAETNQALNSMFEQGRINRDKEVSGIIEGNKQVLEADKARIDALLAQKDEEVRRLRERSDLSASARQEEIDRVFKEGEKLQQERLDKESEFELTSRELKAKAAKDNAESRRNQAQNETDILVGELDGQIKATEEAIKRGATVEEEGLTLIEQLEEAKIDARRDGLERQILIGRLTIQEQENLNNELQKLGQEADRLREGQEQKRLERAQQVAERNRQIRLDELDALLEVERIRGESLIATIQALAALRVKTEEDAAKEILKIRLGLIDSEIEATKAKLEATASIVDIEERTRTRSELNNRIKVLNAERVAIENQGNRDVDEARKTDIANERRYVDELLQLRRRITDTQREAARTVIDLMILHHARRRDVFRAEAELEQKEEDDRHRREIESIAQQRLENAESNRTKEEKLERDKELNRLKEEEEERHRLKIKAIQKQKKEDEDETSPIGRIGIDIEDLEDFANTIEQSIVPLNELLTKSFLQVADAIGQTVQNWVLLGTTGPAVMRKILAQALASIAAEAAVNAIKELALGFAMLFINPAESAGHFTAAALWASIGGVAAIAGRGLAGDLFKPKETGGGTGSTRGSGSRTTSQTVNPIDLARTQQREELHIFVHAEPGARFNDAVVNALITDVQRNGSSREVIIHTAGG